MSPRLEEAVRRLYEAFGGYAFNPRMERCDHCIDDRELAVLESSPLEALDGDSISLLTSNLLLTVGDVPDFKHFLPRLFQVTALDPAKRGYSSEMLFSNLSAGGWKGWPDAEREAVREFLEAYWDDRLSSYPGPEQAWTFVCNVALSDAEPPLFIERWWTAGDVAAALHLASFLEREREQPNAFWEDKPLRDAWMGLLRGDRSLRLLERWMEHPDAGPHAGALAASRSALTRRGPR